MQHSLLLNATYEPLQVVSWKRAVRMFFQEKVDVIEVYEQQLRSVSLTIPMPSVIKLRHYVKVRRSHSQVKFSRSNLYARDGYSCQYCGRRLPPRDLTYDHVIPVARGGRKSWENIVTCCVRCNRRKGNRTPEEAGLHLRKLPAAPLGFPSKVFFLFSRSQAPETWRSYIFWHPDDGGSHNGNATHNGGNSYF